MKQALMDVPNDMRDTVRLRLFLQSLHSALSELQAGILPPDDPSNLTITPGPGYNVVTFTRSVNADKFIVYAGATADLSKANPSDIGLAAEWTDNVGAGAVTRYYWVKAKLGPDKESNVVGPKVGATLALNAPGAIPTVPTAGQQLVVTDDGKLQPGLLRDQTFDSL